MMVSSSPPSSPSSSHEHDRSSSSSKNGVPDSTSSKTPLSSSPSELSESLKHSAAPADAAVVSQHHATVTPFEDRPVVGLKDGRTDVVVVEFSDHQSAH